MGLRNRSLFKDEQCFFVTTTCNKWLQLIHLANGYQLIQDSLRFVNNKYSALILGYVIMPNHLHFILFFDKENMLSEYMRDFKKFTSTKLRQHLESNGNKNILTAIGNNAPNRAFQVWKDRFDDVYIESKWVLERKLDYIHTNPLQEQWNLVVNPEDYEYSSASFYELGKQNRLEVVDYRNYF